ncbi:MAG: prepilin-type N-terminal cleavage/methylation domain-containing protein [Candidatus Taylorbacteria bacterium]|nr:prepilin-type N-terminal cleavage/methylation domain-containing protein [Candidatus Taylorbacteria bacterium]
MKTRAFTLIELLVVISIISLLSSVVLSNLNSAREKARLAAVGSFAAQADRIAGEQAVGVWDFDECSGSLAADRSGFGNNGSVSGSPTWSSDTPTGRGCSLSLSGSAQYVNAGNGQSLNMGTGDMSLSVWVKTSSTASNLWIVDKKTAGTNNPGFDLSTIGTLYFRIANGSSQIGVTATGGAVIGDGRWHHIVAVVNRSNSTLYLYIDGKLNNTNSFNNTWNLSGSDTLAFGGYGGGTGGNFPGSIDNVRLFSKILAASEVGDLYALESSHFFAAR